LVVEPGAFDVERSESGWGETKDRFVKTEDRGPDFSGGFSLERKMNTRFHRWAPYAALRAMKGKQIFNELYRMNGAP
jgi:hypothetical protein